MERPSDKGGLFCRQPAIFFIDIAANCIETTTLTSLFFTMLDANPTGKVFARIFLKFSFIAIPLAVSISAFQFSAAAQNAPKAIEIPFEFFKNEIFVQANIDGQGPFTMLVDTGTDPSAIDLETAKTIGLKLSSKAHKSSGGGTVVNTTYACKFASVELSGLIAKNVEAGAIDLTKISERLGRHIDGVFGQSLLNGRIVQFDYPAKILRFFDRSPPPKTGSTTLLFRYDDDLLIPGVVVNGQQVTANLDTGSSGSFQLSPAAVTSLKLSDQAIKSPVTTSVGYNGEFENRTGILKVVKIGEIIVKDAPVQFYEKGSGHDSVPWSLNIGNVFLKDFVVTIDYREKAVNFEKP
jgi:predicted aspartyl protease